MTNRWDLINFSKCNGYANMAIDEALYINFKHRTDKQLCGIVRFYEFIDSAVTLGCFQKMSQFPTGKFSEDYDIVRRITGGGLVNHDESLTFSLISKQEAHEHFATVGQFYKMLHCALFKGFLGCGIRLSMHTKPSQEMEKPIDTINECFSQPVEYDLMYKGVKIVGGAQKRSHGYVLHQSSIYLGIDEWKERPYLRGLLRNVIVKQMEDLFDIKFDARSLTTKETEDALRLEEGKYRTEEWRNKY
ncbi:biotin/lipoate A/B protein ligase family protein [Candidatus Omnitrophota bacterium]